MGGAAVVAVGVGIQAYGAYRGLRASSVQAKYQAQIDRMNAALKEERKRDIRTTGERAKKQVERETIQFIGDQVTAFASGNIDISSAVVTEAVEGTAKTGAADILELSHNIRRDIWGLDVGIMSDEMSAAFNRMRARRLRRFAPIAAVATALAGAPTS